MWYDTALAWLELNYGWVAIGIAVIIYILYQKGVFKKKKRRREDSNDVPPLPPNGSEFAHIELGELGWEPERKKVEYELSQVNRHRERISSEYKAAVDEYKNKLLYYQKIDKSLRIKLTLLNKQLQYINEMMKTEEQLRGEEYEER
jgi:hypothetical protein